MKWEAGKIYKINRDPAVIGDSDTYIFVVGIEGEESNRKLIYNYLDDIGRRAITYCSDLVIFNIEEVV